MPSTSKIFSWCDRRCHEPFQRCVRESYCNNPVGPFPAETLDANSFPSRPQAGVPVRGPGGGDQPPLPRLLRGARRVPPAARPAALQLRRLQRQIPAPLPLQGLPQRPGGAVQGLPMTRAGSCGRPALSLDTLKGEATPAFALNPTLKKHICCCFFSHEVAVETNPGPMLSLTVHGYGSYPNKIEDRNPTKLKTTGLDVSQFVLRDQRRAAQTHDASDLLRTQP